MSILNSIKILLGIPAEHEAFDQQLVIHINSVFTILDQLGVGPFTISGATETWEDYFEECDDVDLEVVRSYMYMKVRMMFDPPVGAAADAFNKMISEYEWRLSVEADMDAKTE